MFGITKSGWKRTGQGLALVSAAAALLALGGTADAAWPEHGPRGRWHEREGVSVRGEIIVGGGRIVIGADNRWGHRPPEPPRCIEVAPCDLRMTAYQSEDRVILLINGSNRGDGFRTWVASCDLRDASPTIELHNLMERACGDSAERCFTINTSFRAHCNVRCIRVVVAGRAVDVPVTQTQCLS